MAASGFTDVAVTPIITIPPPGSIPSRLAVAVWTGDAAHVQAVLRSLVSEDADTQQSTLQAALDEIGPTGELPLHLALRCGYIEIAKMLIEAGATFRHRDKDSWPSLYGALMLYRAEGGAFSRLCYKIISAETEEETKRRLSHMYTALERVPDFTVEIEFKFETWIPMLGRLLPADVCKVSKVGSSIRLDCTLAGMKGLSWKRGDLSFIFYGRLTSRPGKLLVFDHINKRYADMGGSGMDAAPDDIRDATDMMAVSPWPNMDWWSRDVEFVPEPPASGGGWLSSIVSRGKPALPPPNRAVDSSGAVVATEEVGGYAALLYRMRNLRMDVELRPALMPEMSAEVNARIEAKIKEEEEAYLARGPDDVTWEEADPDEAATPSGDRATSAILRQAAGGAARKALDYVQQMIMTEQEEAADDDDSDGDATSGSADDGVGARSLHIRCGGVEQLLVRCAAGAECQWEVGCAAHDIGIRVQACPRDGGEPTEVVAVPRVTSHSGSHRCEVDCDVVLSLDNTYAYWHDKDVVVTLRRLGDPYKHRRPKSQMRAEGGAESAAGPETVGKADGSSEAGASTAPTAARKKRLRGFEGHPLSHLIASECGLKTSAFQDYFHISPDIVRAEYGYPTSGVSAESVPALPDTAVFVEAPHGRKFTKTFVAKVAMAQEFPVTVDDLLPVAEVLSRTSKHFENLNRFLRTKMPPGFPVKFDIPVVPALSTRVQFRSVRLHDDKSTASPAQQRLIIEPQEYRNATGDFTANVFFDRCGVKGNDVPGENEPGMDGAGELTEEEKNALEADLDVE